MSENTQFESERAKAFDKALSYLSRAVKTESQMKKYLFDKGFSARAVFAALEKLKDYGFINDAEYVVSYVNTYKNKKGARLIKYELKQKGISENIIDGFFSADIAGQEETALRIAEKYIKNRERTYETYSKVYRMLLSKGFSYENADYAVNKIKESECRD